MVLGANQKGKSMKQKPWVVHTTEDADNLNNQVLNSEYYTAQSSFDWECNALLNQGVDPTQIGPIAAALKTPGLVFRSFPCMPENLKLALFNGELTIQHDDNDSGWSLLVTKVIKGEVAY